MNIAFEHLAIPSPNPASLRDWYVRVLGAREIFNSGQNPPTLLIALPGGGWFEIYAATGTPTLEDRATTSWPAFGTSRCAWTRWTRRKRNWKSAA